MATSADIGGSSAIEERGDERRDGDAARWWVLRVKARQEKTVARTLDAAGVEFLLPVQRRRQAWARGRVYEIPLFPGYVFARSAGRLSDRELGVGRVVQVIRVEDQARLDHELRQIRLAMEAGVVLAPAKYLERGTRVVVTGGALRGVEGVVEGLDAPDRVYLQVHTLGRALTVEVSPTLVARAG
ncbi:MAG: transcription termination/antitermination NusG family protein [Planctomycetota bacterium]|nr:transcription termination/antitermination NusG family protein [Planctomycetota bacterium]